MRHGDDRHVHSREVADLARVHPPRVNDDLRLDVAAIGLDRLDATASHADAGHTGALLDLGSAAPCPLGQGERELARVDVAVRREVRGPEHAVGRHGREVPLRLRRRDQLEGQAERLRPAGLPCDLLHPLLRRREPERAHLPPSGLEPDLRLQRAIEVDARHHHLRQGERASQLPDEARGVERGAARELSALDEHDVLPAESRQPVEHRAPADAASDHHRPRAVPHAEEPRSDE